VYEHIIFDNHKHQSVCLFPKLAERSFIVFSFGKTYHTTGWKMGYVLAPERLMAEFRKVHQFVVFCVNTPLQYALADYMNKKEEYLQLGSFYKEKDTDFAIRMTKEMGVASVPTSVFYHEPPDSKLLRFCFAKTNETLEKA